MPRPPKVWWSDRERCWMTSAVGELSEATGRKKPVRNREIGPPVGPDGRRNEKLARDWLRALLDAEAAAERRGTEPTVADLAELYCDWSAGAGRRELRTVRGHAERLRTFCAFRAGGVLYGDRPARELKPVDLQRFLAHHAREGYGVVYTNSITLTVMAMLNWAARPVADRVPERILAANPFAGVERPKVPAPPKRYCGPEAGRAFLGHARRRACAHPVGGRARRFDRLAVELLRFVEATGCRPSEACRLEWGHIQWGDGRAVLRGKTTGATGRPRVIPLTPEVLRLLRAVERLPGRHGQFVFTHQRRDGQARGLAGVPWTPNALAHKVRQWRDEAIAEARAEAEAGGRPVEEATPIRGEGPAALTLYAFRRDMGADVLRGGGSYADVAEVLGNSAAVAEKHYASFASDHSRALARGVAERRRERERARPAGAG